MANKNIAKLVECLYNSDYLTANKLFGQVVEDIQKKRVRIIKEDNDLNLGDDDADTNLDGQDGGDDANPTPDEQAEVADDVVETDGIMDEISDIEVKINKRVILGLLNKLSELGVLLTNSELDKNDTQYITFDETMNTYKKILQELQNQTTLAVDQKEVLSKVELVKSKIVDLENEMESLKAEDTDVDGLTDEQGQTEADGEGEGEENNDGESLGDEESGSEGEEDESGNDGGQLSL